MVSNYYANPAVLSSCYVLLGLVALLSDKNVELMASAKTIDRSNCEPVENLGNSNLDRFMYATNLETSTIDAEGSCSYDFQIMFKHDSTLPVPSDFASQCDPTIVPPAIASDGLPYFAFRWNYQSVPQRIKKVTGIDHVSIDFNPCGHPPTDVFNIPHYDLHLYLVDPEYRRCMTCDLIPGAPVCDPTPGSQSTSNGRGFFNINSIFGGGLANMPSGYDLGVGDMIPLMGGHAWDISNQPNASNPWVDPLWIMGPYDGTLVNYEPMIPLSFMIGTDDKHHEQSLTYEGQTMHALPSKVTTAYDASSGFTTLSLEGKSYDCGDDKGNKKQKKKGKKQKRNWE